MENIPVGAKREEKILVTSDVAIDFMGVDSARVLSTPHLVGFLEMTCRNLLKELVGEGRDSVGTHVEISHLAATPIGMQVRLRGEIVAVNEHRVNFRVEAYDEQEKVGEGSHQRFVVDVARFASRVQAKAAAK